MEEPIQELMKPESLSNSNDLNEELEKILHVRYSHSVNALASVEELIVQQASQSNPSPLNLVGKLWTTQGDLLFQVGSFEAALEAFTQAGNILEQESDHSGVAITRSWKGRIYLQRCAYLSALQNLIQGLDLATAADNKAVIGRLLEDLGYLYVERGENLRALNNLLRAVQYARENNDWRTLAGAKEKLCRVYTNLENPAFALDVGGQGLSISREYGLRSEEAQVLTSLAVAHQSLKEYSQAHAYLQEALQIADEIGLPFEECRAWLSEGLIFIDEKSPANALEPLTSALTLAEEIQARGLEILCHQALSSAYRQVDQYQSALEHYEFFHELKEKAFDEDSESKLKNLEVIYQVESVRRETEIEQNKIQSLRKEVEERSRVQQDLQNSNTQLQREIALHEQLISDLNAFTRMVAHDLKTPLQSIAIIAHLLEIQVEKMPENNQAMKLITQLQQTYQKSNMIIQELLTLASLRSQEIQPEPFDMDRVMHEVLKRIDFLVVQYQAEINFPDQWPTVNGHASWIEEVWTNYLNNAIKYGGTPPVVQIGASPLEDGMVKFWIQDNGEGIKPEDQSRLFIDFSRLDNNFQLDGHGLGLSIVRRIIEKMGGKVGVESRGRSGEGSRFWFTLPAATPTDMERDPGN